MIYMIIIIMIISINIIIVTNIIIIFFSHKNIGKTESQLFLLAVGTVH